MEMIIPTSHPVFFVDPEQQPPPAVSRQHQHMNKCSRAHFHVSALPRMHAPNFIGLLRIKLAPTPLTCSASARLCLKRVLPITYRLFDSCCIHVYLVYSSTPRTNDHRYLVPDTRYLVRLFLVHPYDGCCTFILASTVDPSNSPRYSTPPLNPNLLQIVKPLQTHLRRFAQFYNEKTGETTWDQPRPVLPPPTSAPGRTSPEADQHPRRQPSSGSFQAQDERRPGGGPSGRRGWFGRGRAPPLEAAAGYSSNASSSTAVAGPRRRQ